MTLAPKTLSQHVWGIVMSVGERWHKPGPGRFIHHSKATSGPVKQKP